MASIAVLHPQDCIKNHLPRRRPLISPPQIHNPQKTSPNSTRSDRRKRSPEKKTTSNKPRNSSLYDSPIIPLVMGQVKILKRGEQTTPSKNPAGQKKGAELTNSVGMEPKPMRIGDFYAGSAVISSPPPSSLPLPGFFTKKNVLGINDDASAGLRRLLRLDLV